MGLAEQLLAPSDMRRGSRCSVAATLIQLDKADPKVAEALRAVLAMPQEQMPSTVIERRLENTEYALSASTIQRHRRGACACQR